MRIRKLELQGFKSFADRAIFHFGAGISGVVGPNGCGKSNVVDGVKWCLGEQRVKTLRGDTMADVIFAGSTGRGSVSFAEVSLTFEAGAEPFPGIWERHAELDVSRRLYRDGSSEYRINAEKVRLRDVNELFLDSGAGNQLYSFIEQGRIGQIVAAHPEQRRSLIEEAAGISRYKQRREETLEKLASTRASLDRVGDIAEELARQLRGAERAVVRAMKAREVTARLRQEEIRLGLLRCHGLIAERRALGVAVREATAAMALATSSQDRSEAELTARRAALEAGEAEVGEGRDALGKAEADRRVEESAVQFQAREATSVRQRLEQLARDVDGLRAERDLATGEAVAAKSLADAADGALPGLRGVAAALGEDAQSMGLAVSRVRATLEEARAVAVASLEAAVRARGARDGVALRLRDLDERARRHEQRVVEARSLQARLGDEVARVEAQVVDADTRVNAAKTMLLARAEEQTVAQAGRDQAGAGVREAEAVLAAAAEALAEVQRRVSGQEAALRQATALVQERFGTVRKREEAWTSVDRDRAALLARIDALDDALRRSTDAPDGLRKALAVPGVLGLLAPRLDAAEGRDVVLARALDGGLETVLVPDVATAVRVATVAAGTRARVLVVPSMEGSREGLEDVGGTVDGRRALAALAPSVAEVATVADAFAARAVDRGRTRFVTADGAVLREDGVLLLGVGVAGTEAFARKRELVGLREGLLGLEAVVKAAAEAVRAARASVVAAEAARAEVTTSRNAEVAAVSEAQAQVDLARATVQERARAVAPVEASVRVAGAAVEAARAALRSAESVASEIRARLEARVGSVAEAVRTGEQLVAAGEAIRGARAALEADEQAAADAIRVAEERQGASEEAVRLARRDLAEAEPKLTALQAEIATARMAVAAVQATLQTQGGLADTARARAERATARIGQAGQEQSRLETRLVEIAVEAEAGQNRLQSLGERIGVLRDELDAGRARVVDQRATVRQGEEAARLARDRRDAARDALTAVETRFAAVKDALERLRGDVEARHEVSLVALLDRLDRDGQLLLDGWTPVPVDGIATPEPVATLRIGRGELDTDEAGPAALAELSTRVADLRASLNRLGDVQPGAEDEYREVSARHAEIVRQRADLEEAMRIIEDVIAQLNRTCRERFRETFDQVADHYADVYPRLVGGGTGRLALTDEDDLLVTGVEMYVQPPGKKIQQLSLLSGGEKAMAAIALIFALFRVKPSPFCLLDEVDAPLDEGNGARFNDMLREMAQRSQFIVITHNKKTMECADVLYGVSMPEPGVSRLVTVKLE